MRSSGDVVAPDHAPSGAAVVDVVGRLRWGDDPDAVARRVRPGDVVLLRVPAVTVTVAQVLAARGASAVLLEGDAQVHGPTAGGAVVLLDAGVPVGRLAAPAEGLLRRPFGRRRVRWDGQVLARGSRAVPARPLDADLERERWRRDLARAVAAAGAAASAAAGAVAAAPELLTEGSGLEADAATDRGRPCIVVADGAEADLRSLRRWRRRARPRVVATSDGAGAALKARLPLDALVGDLAAVPDEALDRARRLVALTGGTSWDGGVARATAGGRRPEVLAAPLDPVTAGLLVARAWKSPLVVVAGGVGDAVDPRVRAVRALAGLRSASAADVAALQSGPRRVRLAAGLAVVLVGAGVVLAAAPPSHGWGAAVRGAVDRLSGRPAGRARHHPEPARAAATPVSGEALAAALGPGLEDRALAGHRVLLVVTPTADRSTVAGVADDLVGAGVTAVERLDLGPAFVDPAQRVLRSALADRLAPWSPRPTAQPADLGVAVLADALGDGVLTRSRGHLGRLPSGRTVTLLAGLTAASALEPAAGPPRRTDVAVLVSAAGDDPATTAALAAGLAAHAAAVLAVGPPDGGAVAGVRHDSAVAGVATVDDPAGDLGRLTVVRAVVAALAGHAGAWGTGPGAVLVPGS